MQRRLSFMVSEELFERVERARGDVARERWLRRAVERALEPPRAAERGFDPPAPAEQPEPITAEEVGADLNALRAQRGELPVRVWADRPARDFTPYPKGGKR